MTAKLKPTTKLRAVRDQVSCAVEDEAVILHLKEGVYFGLNPVGAFVWNNLKQIHPFSELKAKVLAEFDVSDEQCEADLQELFADLLKAGLIEVVTEPAA